MTWRDQYEVHPAADVFPMMSDEELDALGADIKANGLKTPIVFHPTSGEQNLLLIDGRNRLEAIERAGITVEKKRNVLPHYKDPVSHIISLNIRRRHLTKAQQADLIVAAVKAGEKPRQDEVVSRGGRGKVNTVKAKAVKIAEQAGVSKSTVERAIAKAEANERGIVSEPKKIAGPRLKTKPKLETHTGIDAARRYYLEQCQHPDVDLDAEQDIIIDALREIAGKRAMACMKAAALLGDGKGER
jgi:hypothetical protein